LAAGAFPVFFRTENLLTEEAILFRPVRTVIDRLRLFDFAERPGANIVRAGQADADSAVIIDAIVACRLAGAGGNGGRNNRRRAGGGSAHMEVPLSEAKFKVVRIGLQGCV